MTGGLILKSEPEGDPSEEILHVRAKKGGEISGGKLEGVGSGWNNLKGGGVAEESELELDMEEQVGGGGGVWDRFGEHRWGNVAPTYIRNGE